MSTPSSSSKFAIAFEIARILRQVFRRSELQGVHEDGHRHHIAFRLGRTHQREMAFVQRAHRRHEAETSCHRAARVGEAARMSSMVLQIFMAMTRPVSGGRNPVDDHVQALQVFRPQRPGSSETWPLVGRAGYAIFGRTATTRP